MRFLVILSAVALSACAGTPGIRLSASQETALRRSIQALAAAVPETRRERFVVAGEDLAGELTFADDVRRGPAREGGLNRRCRPFVATLTKPRPSALAGEACIEPNSKLGPDPFFWKISPFSSSPPAR
jgi:hypothetical protein